MSRCFGSELTVDRAVRFTTVRLETGAIRLLSDGQEQLPLTMTRRAYHTVHDISQCHSCGEKTESLRLQRSLSLAAFVTLIPEVVYQNLTQLE